MASITDFTKRHLFLLAGITLGAVAGALILAQLNQLKVHETLLEHEPIRAYVSVDCIHCQKAIDAISQHPGDKNIVLVPLPGTTMSDDHPLCVDAIRTIRNHGSFMYKPLPQEKLCRRLMTEARAWLEGSDGQVEVPAWVIRDQSLAPGWSEENIAVLQREGILARTFTPLQ